MWPFNEDENLRFDNGYLFIWTSYKESCEGLNVDLLTILYELHVLYPKRSGLEQVFGLSQRIKECKVKY